MKKIYNHTHTRVEYYNDKNQLHREDGPAIEYDNGDFMYFINGNLHRTDGPAMKMNNNETYIVNGRFINKNQYNKIMLNKKINRLLKF